MTYILRGVLPVAPAKAAWWGIECWDGRSWLKLDAVAEAGKNKKGKKTDRWWPVSTAPTPDHIGETWGSGWYRITWTQHDKRKSLTVSEAFAVIDNSDPNLANLLNALAGGPSNHNLLNPEQLMNLPPHMAPAAAELRCTHCGRSEGETPLATFQTMFLLLDKHLDRQAEQMRNQHQLALADLRSNQQVALEQTRAFYQEMHAMSLAPRLAALESQLRDLSFDDLEADDPSLAQVAKEVAPALVMMAQRYLETRARKQPSSPTKQLATDEE